MISARERRHQRLWKVLAEHHATLSQLPRWGQQALGELLHRYSSGVRLLVPSPSGGALPIRTDRDLDAYVVGPFGVAALLSVDRRPDDDQIRRLHRGAERLLGAIPLDFGRRIASVRMIVVRPDHLTDLRTNGRYLVRTAADVPTLVADRDYQVLSGASAVDLAGRIAAALPDHVLVDLPETAPPPEEGSLFGAAGLRESSLRRAVNGPFAEWLTYLDETQLRLVHRQYNGPARISGPAGTGKTVVALHRLRRIARETTGPLLLTTLVTTLLRTHATSFRRLAPEVADRVRVENLHLWARQFLEERGRHVRNDHDKVSTCFFLAWSKVNRQTDLPRVNANPQYWREEIDHVIKGRGINDLAEYQRANRRGRGIAGGGLDAGRREQVWQLHQAYQRNLAERGLTDHNDVLVLATEEVRERPLAEPFAAVVVDEVQDLPQVGLRLLHTLVGDRPDGLLLVGDGQQQVYPGGWRLIDAGIHVQGRGETLRVNYRNTRAVLAAAQDVPAPNQLDEEDGAPGATLREVTATLAGGTVHRWSGPAEELEQALVTEAKVVSEAHEETAVLLGSNDDVSQAIRWLRQAGVLAMPLKDYDGTQSGVKVGTVHRAKGMEFGAVLVVLRGTEDDQDASLMDRRLLVAITRARDHAWLATVR
ncbi:DNA helicase UvrD [Actinoalloteichus sp. AHMU CJ021]|uniref:UvrD-helicase domain-containing protein n=1 Tax=Actinoalloteichus sp. AHMU CJ021 TaxID=2072503 RepID=UPI000CA07260|nr:DNA helicase UvrD [Actinoalloteichus sp. AHMU CJ021]